MHKFASHVLAFLAATAISGLTLGATADEDDEPDEPRSGGWHPAD